MKLAAQQIAFLEKVITRLEAADSFQQSALGASEVSEDLHNRIEDLLAEIELLLEECDYAE